MHVLECLKGEVKFTLAHDKTFEDFLEVVVSILVLVTSEGVHAMEGRYLLGDVLHFLFKHEKVVQVIVLSRGDSKHEALHHVVPLINNFAKFSESLFFYIFCKAIATRLELVKRLMQHGRARLISHLLLDVKRR